MSRYILAIDQGTSSTKSIIFDDAARSVARASAPLHTDYSADGRAEQDPEAIVRSVLDSVAACVAHFEEKAGLGRDRIECAGIANQRETFVIWGPDGVPLHPAVVWQCKRSTGICSQLREDGAEQTVRERSGLIIDPYFSGTKATWLIRNVPEIRAAHRAETAHFGTVDSWILHKLTDGQVHATDHTNASRTLLFNIHSLDWDDRLAALLECPELRLPEVSPSAHHFGASTFNGIFPSPLPITAMVGDSHAALFGERCFAPGSAKATLGTGSSILINGGASVPSLSPSAMSTIGFSLPDRVDYALEGIIVSAGSVLTWLGNELGLFADSSELDDVADTVSDAGGVCMIPGHAGLGAPFWRMDAKGAVTGLTFGTGKAHVLRAALESIPYQIRAILDAVNSETGVGCAAIKADGGISRNRFVIDWLSSTLGVPVHTFGSADVTALGAAFLAGLGAGIYRSLADIDSIVLDEHVTRGDHRADAQAGYDRWRAAVDRVVSPNPKTGELRLHDGPAGTDAKSGAGREGEG